MTKILEISSFFLFILGILFPFYIEAADEGNGKIYGAGVYVKVLGQSGKTMISRSENIESDANRVTVEMDEIKETDMSGNPVGAGGAQATTHSFNTFANRQFEYSKVGDGEFENMSAKTFNFSTTIDNGAKLGVDVYIFTENGTYSPNGENTTVSVGSVKFNIYIDKWKFCGDSVTTCSKGSTTEIGKYIDVTIAIKGKGSSLQTKTGGGKKTTADEYDLGSGSSVIISDKVQYDDNGDWVSTPSGYPKLVQKSAKALFVFRFDKFSKSVLYDPHIDLGKSSDTPDTPTMDKETNAEGVWVKILGKSGKIQLGNMPNPSHDPNRIIIEFSELKEKKTDGSDIQDNKHRFNNFAVTDFRFTSPIDAKFMNLTVKRITLNATLNSEGTMLITEVLIFRENGEITIGNETTIVKKGNMKFSTTIKDWKFCGHGGTTCSKSEVGEFLDFGMTIKGNGTTKKKTSTDKGNAEEYDLGGGSSLVMSRKVKYNTDDWTTMANGYPMFVTQGSKQIFYIRLNKFTGTAYYDPTVIYNLGDTGGSSRNDGISWKLLTKPAVFGGDITLECKFPEKNCCDKFSRRWFVGRDLHLLIMNGASVYPQKYTEDLIPDSYLSKLTIHSFNSTDVNVPYACSYGFVKDVKVLKLTEEEFESYPSEPLDVNVTTSTENVLLIYISMVDVFPVPNCTASLDDEDISDFMKIIAVRSQVLYAVTIHISYQMPLSSCSSLFYIFCRVGANIYKTERKVICKKNNDMIDIEQITVNIVIPLVLVTSTLALCSLCILILQKARKRYN